MNPLTETLWTSFAAGQLNKSEELERLRKSLFFKLTAATSEELTWKICDLCEETEDFAAREAFRRGLCLGGQLVLCMLGEDFTP